MDGGTTYSIGELARRTGLSVKTIRFYSDRGIVPPAERTPAGYRRYGPGAVARLALVRTLRELGLSVEAIRQVVDRELTLGQVAADHAAALDVQISLLRLRRAVLAAAASREPTFEEMERMHQLATLSAAERHRLVEDFHRAVFDNPREGSRLAALRRSITPELPANPTEEQVTAWVELAELSLDPEFRALIRRQLEDHAADLPEDAVPPRPDIIAITQDLVKPALAAGIAPDSPDADPVVATLTAHCARAVNRPDDAELREWLRHRLAAANDARRDRYFQLLAVINGWPPPELLAPVLDWSVRALALRAAR